MVSCDICGKEFNYDCHLVRHLGKKFPCKPKPKKEEHQCVYCQKVLSTPYTLIRHDRTCKMKEDDVRQLEMQLEKDVSLEPDTNVCRFCNKNFFNRRNMKRHDGVCKSKKEYKNVLMEEIAISALTNMEAISVPLTDMEPISAPTEKPKKKTRFSESLKKQIAARQSWRCSSCDKILESTFQVDHTTPLCAGGEDSPSNATAMCVLCHALKTQNEAIKRYMT
jgi:hypothetical protein